MSRRYVCYLEIGVFFILLMVYIWGIMPLGIDAVNYLFVCFLALFTIVSNIRHKLNLKTLGIRLDNFLASLKTFLPVILIISLLFLLTGWLLKSLRLSGDFVISLLTYPIWGMVQQYALQSFINNRLRMTFNNEYLVALICAILFAAVHLPNIWLMAFCFIGGYFVSFFYGRQPNLFAASIIHGILASTLSHSLPRDILHGMVVGPGFYR